MCVSSSFFINRTMGKFVLNLIENKRYQSIMLPIIPVTAKREWDVNILKLQALDNREVLPGEIHEGDSVMGFYGVDLMWYPARVLRVLSPNSYYLVYDGYNNKEVRTRGHVLMKGENPMLVNQSQSSAHAHSHSHSRSRSRSRSSRESHSRSRSRSSRESHSRSRSRSGSRGHREDSRERGHSHRHGRRSGSRSPAREEARGMFDEKRLVELAREKERQAAVSDGHSGNVGHVKYSLLLKMDRFTARKEDSTPEKPVIVNTIEAEDSLLKAKEEEERKRKEAESKKRLAAIQKMYTRNKEEDEYNRDYY